MIPLWVRIGATAAVTAAVFLAGSVLGHRLTKAAWDQERATLAQQRANAERLARDEENRRAKEAQRILEEQGFREAALRARAASAERAVVSLRDEIARLNGRAVPADPVAAGFAHEARVARELLGSCTKEYQGLAAEADGLRDQVTGLQQWVSRVTQ